MYTIYLTGGIGAGKTTVSGRLAGHGARIIDLDVVGHEVLCEDEAKRELVDKFGDAILNDDGEVNRAKLAVRAFADEESTAALDSIMHPLILARLARMVDETQCCADLAGRPPLVAIEVQVAQAADPALVDEVVTLACPVEVRRERAISRGMARDDFDARNAAQADDDLRAALADTVLDVSGDLATVERAVDAWWEERESSGWRSPAALAREMAPTPRAIAQPEDVPSPTIAFVGRHNSGKTTLAVRVIAELAQRGIDVGSVKHHGHRGFDIDVPGKDSWRHHEAGACEVAISAPGKFALIRDLSDDEEMSMEQAVSAMRPHDVVIVEGYRHSRVPAIEVMRSENERDRSCGEAFVASAKDGSEFSFDPSGLRAMLGRDADRLPGESTVAVATDMPRVRAAALSRGMRAFDVNDASGIAEFIIQDIVR